MDADSRRELSEKRRQFNVFINQGKFCDTRFSFAVAVCICVKKIMLSCEILIFCFEKETKNKKDMICFLCCT